VGLDAEYFEWCLKRPAEVGELMVTGNRHSRLGRKATWEFICKRSDKRPVLNRSGMSALKSTAKVNINN
jgi:hypothetical protein